MHLLYFRLQFALRELLLYNHRGGLYNLDC